MYDAAKALPTTVKYFLDTAVTRVAAAESADLGGFGVLLVIVHIPISFFLCWLSVGSIPCPLSMKQD
jgi:hypothetical protein